MFYHSITQAVMPAIFCHNTGENACYLLSVQNTGEDSAVLCYNTGEASAILLQVKIPAIFCHNTSKNA